MKESPEPGTRGGIVVLAALCINLVLGFLYAWSVIGKALVVQWHWSKAEAALPFTMATATFAFTMIFAGRWQDRIGPKQVALLGGVLLGGGLAVSSLARTPMTMLLAFGILGGAGIGLGYSATTPPSIKWFPAARKGLITGIVVSGVGLAAVYTSPLAELLLKRTSIPQTFLVLGIAAMVIVSALSRLLANPPAAPSAARAAGPENAVSTHGERDWHQMLRSKQFYQLWLMFVLSASAGLMIIGHVAIIAREQAHWEKGFVAVMVVAIFNTLGRLVSGLVSDRVGRTKTMVFAFAIQALNMAVFAQYSTPALLVLGSAIAGLCYGTIFTLFPAATADFYGVRNLGVNYGLVFTAFGFAGVSGPLLAGRIRDAVGTYGPSFKISAAMLACGALLALVTKAPRWPERHD